MTFVTIHCIDAVKSVEKSIYCTNNNCFQVFLDDFLCGTIKYTSNTNPYWISCGVRHIRQVTIVKKFYEPLAEMALTLCEIEVYSKNPPS